MEGSMNVFIVEDSALVREQLTRLVEAKERFRVVGWAGEEERAVSAILAQRPDVVLLDIALSPGSGVNVLRRIRAAGSGARVLVMTHSADQALRDACEAIGISGHCDKGGDLHACFEQMEAWLPPVPENEAQRLAALESTGLLDTPEDEAFDSLARVARNLTGAPIALISLIDHSRQWFLSHLGLPERETSRSMAFCAHAILQTGLMEVPDALEDERFRDNPLVQGNPRLRYYAGVPLVLDSGEALGTLCVLDTVPRRLDEAQRDAIKTLARSVVGEIELRRRVLTLEQEIERRHAAEARIMHLATRDPLTGLPNRTVLRDRLEHEVHQAARRGGTVAAMFIDLDRFKLVNDTLGHDVGDEFLMVVAQRLSSTLREADTVARLGGDEFAAILPDMHSDAEALLVAHKLLRALAEPFTIGKHRLRIDASIGIACYPHEGDSAEVLLRHADLAMYQSKQGGGNRATHFTAQMETLAVAALALDRDLDQAIERRELVLEFQPQGVPGGREVAGWEALVRWNHPKLGRLMPDRFIPLAEERGWIHRIGRHVIDSTLAQIATWDRAGTRIPRIAVNLSPSELRAGLADEIDALVYSHGLTPDRLALEITETAIVGDGAEVAYALTRLSQKGYSIEVDDFGAGYSSLGQLRHLPLETLKIDKSLIDDVHHSKIDTALVGAVIDMARALGMRTVAEGVELPEQERVLTRLGCDSYQGYLLGKPMPAARVPDWLAQRSAAGPVQAG
jgi:diguanylate cyclase (GGDEF)-like protein